MQTLLMFDHHCYFHKVHILQVKTEVCIVQAIAEIPADEEDIEWRVEQFCRL